MEIANAFNYKNCFLATEIYLQISLYKHSFFYRSPELQALLSWLGGSVVERRSLTGKLSLVCTGPAAVGNHLYR